MTRRTALIESRSRGENLSPHAAPRTAAARPVAQDADEGGSRQRHRHDGTIGDPTEIPRSLENVSGAVRALAGLAAVTFTDPTPSGVVVKAIHITELRSALDPALSARPFRRMDRRVADRHRCQRDSLSGDSESRQVTHSSAPLRLSFLIAPSGGPPYLDICSLGRLKEIR